MIGWSVQNREARIALDVGEEAVHFQNPILPDTHSEMALPLISRDEVIGALTVQSVERGAFSDEDITLLQTMADQLANAIANARLYEASQRAARREALIKEITTKVRASTDLDTILQTTIKEIGDAIGSKRAYIHLVSPEKTNGNTKSNVDVEG
jgi:GAF domain-containing protein